MLANMANLEEKRSAHMKPVYPSNNLFYYVHAAQNGETIPTEQILAGYLLRRVSSIPAQKTEPGWQLTLVSHSQVAFNRFTNTSGVAAHENRFKGLLFCFFK